MLFLSISSAQSIYAQSAQAFTPAQRKAMRASFTAFCTRLLRAGS